MRPWIAAAAIAVLCACGTTRPPVSGTIVAVGVSAEAVRTSAAEEPSIAWEVQSPTAGSSTTTQTPVEVEEIATLLVNGEYERCDELGRSTELDTYTLLETSREAASQALVTRAACAFLMEETASARELARQLFILELYLADVVESLPPHVLAFLTEVQRETMATARVPVSVRTEPIASVRVDGGAHRCPSTPCQLSLSLGDHLFEARAVGASPGTFRRSIQEQTTVDLTLSEASIDELQGQLHDATNDPDVDIEPARRDDRTNLRHSRRALRASR